MKPEVASQTLAKIERTMAADQGASFRVALGKTIPEASDAFRGAEPGTRSHLGASLLGRPCSREIWYTFHWTTLPKFDGRMLRLFNRGHLEEARFIAMLKMIGCEFWQHDSNGKQFRISGYKGHVGGSGDGVARGIPELPGTPVVTEFKTHNSKSFAKVQAEGVRLAKPEHYTQVNLYLDGFGLEQGLYMAVDKNTDEIYAELIHQDRELIQSTKARAIMLVDASEPPKRLSDSPGWWQCRFCDKKGVCHGADKPAVNCRTCRWSTPVDGGKWICEKPGAERDLPEDRQRRGCEAYQMNPSIK